MKQIIKIVSENNSKQRNPVAASLSLGQYQRKIVPNKKAYSRKSRYNEYRD
jgi:hypothetical protein